MRALATAGLAGLLLLAGCGSDDGGDDDASDVSLVDPSVVVDVEVQDNRFAPDSVEVAAGTTVRFSNVGRNDHNVHAGEGTPDVIEIDTAELAPGSTVERRLTEPGTYAYFCSLHGTESAGMLGTIIVTG